MRQGCKIIESGNTTAIICGGEPTDHKCDEKLSVLLLQSGERVPDTPENWEKYATKIVGGSVACSICGRCAIDNMCYNF